MAWYKYQTNKGPYYGTWSRAGFQKAYPGLKILSVTPISQAQAQTSLAKYGYTTSGAKQVSATPAKKTGPSPLQTAQKQLTAAEAATRKGEQAILGMYKGWTPYPELRTGYEEELGIPTKRTALTGLEEQIIGVTDLLKGLASDILSRVQGTFMTESQRRRKEAAERVPLTEQLGEISTEAQRTGVGLERALGQVGQRMTDVEAQRGAELAPLQFAYEARGREEATKRDYFNIYLQEQIAEARARKDHARAKELMRLQKALSPGKAAAPTYKVDGIEVSGATALDYYKSQQKAYAAAQAELRDEIASLRADAKVGFGANQIQPMDLILMLHQAYPEIQSVDPKYIGNVVRSQFDVYAPTQTKKWWEFWK